MRKAFNFYKSYWEQLKLLSDSQKVDILNAICEVQFLEKNIDDVKMKDNISNIVWTGIKHSVLSSLNGYITKQKAINGGDSAPLSKGLSKGSSPIVETPYQQEKEKEKEKEEEKGKEEDKGEVQLVKRTKFKKPTVDEVYDYFLEKTNDMAWAQKTAPKFFYFYESKNWMVGSNKMKIWRSAVSGWVARNYEKEKPKLTAAQKFSKKIRENEIRHGKN